MPNPGRFRGTDLATLVPEEKNPMANGPIPAPEKVSWYLGLESGAARKPESDDKNYIKEPLGGLYRSTFVMKDSEEDREESKEFWQRLFASKRPQDFVAVMNGEERNL